MGLVLLRQKKLSEAEQEFRAVLRKDPEDVEAHTNLGSTFVEMGNIDAGLGEFHAANALRPLYTPAWRELGLALAKQGKWSEAAEALREAAKLQPGDSRTYWNLGWCLTVGE